MPPDPLVPPDEDPLELFCDRGGAVLDPQPGETVVSEGFEPGALLPLVQQGRFIAQGRPLVDPASMGLSSQPPDSATVP